MKYVQKLFVYIYIEYIYIYIILHYKLIHTTTGTTVLHIQFIVKITMYIYIIFANTNKNYESVNEKYY